MRQGQPLAFSSLKTGSQRNPSVAQQKVDSAPGAGPPTLAACPPSHVLLSGKMKGWAAAL